MSFSCCGPPIFKMNRRMQSSVMHQIHFWKPLYEDIAWLLIIDCSYKSSTYQPMKIFWWWGASRWIALPREWNVRRDVIGRNLSGQDPSKKLLIWHSGPSRFRVGSGGVTWSN
jgi:hypothetical protein